MKSILQSLLGVLSMLMLVLYTLIIGLFVFLFIFIKLLSPISWRKAWVDPAIVGVAHAWLAALLWWQTHVLRVRWDVRNTAEFSMNRWYLVVANHQSWVDIFALFYVTRHKIPLLKFFIKKELMKVPVVGQAWWALDYPFMQRHSPAYIAKHPEKADDDLNATRRACEKFSHTPTSIVNFLEGTRFSPEKKARQKSPYHALLRPKAGGLAFAIQALGEQFSSLLDTTIVYQGQAPSFWDLACGRVGTVVIDIRCLEIPRSFIEMDYLHNRDDKKAFQQWLKDIWLDKDQRINELKNLND